ncbi:MAG TPA: hypothetical protein VL326_18995 [Kofleriaceae bacterium]|nr:hypothetical protein [Kofleriaceae bacterium]
MRLLAVIVCLLVARTAAAGEVVSSGPLGMRAPDNLVLGRDKTVIVRVHGTAAVHLVTNAGSISELVTEGGERHATLTLPSEQFPQRAIVAAVDDAGAVQDWLAIPLAGQARVKIDTEPRASVVVRVGTVDFGPVIADGRGVANVAILVPPGIPQATTIATGKKGAIRDKPLPLGVAAFARTLTVCAPAGDHVSVIAVLPTGAPSTIAPKVSASTGMTDAATAATAGPAGVFIAAHHAAPATDTAELTAAFAGEETVRTSCTLRVPPAPPSAIRIAHDRPTFVAGSGAVTLTLALDFPAARRLLVVDTISLAADVGTIGAETHTDDGWTATWTLPDRFEGKSVAHVTATVNIPGGTPVTATLELPLVAAEAAHIDVSAPLRLRADGAAGGNVEARVVDRFGNIVRDAKLETRSRGHVGSFTGGTAATYVAPRTRDPGDDVIEVVDPVSGITGRATVHLDALPRRFALSLRAGYLSNLARVSTPVAMGAIDVRLPVLEENLTLGVQVGGYTTSVMAMDGVESVTGTITSVPVLARVAYRRTLGPIDAWAGAGAGVARATSEVTSASAGTQHEAANLVAATGFTGAAKRVGPGWIVVEAGYLHATMPADALLTGRTGGVLVTGGFTYELR